jgi:sigma-B regulation protein RsbU (phosphoserine phosphatase)
MKLTAAQIGAALENARLYAALDRYSKALNAELEKGKNIQREFLPDQIPLLPGWEIAVCFQPARQVSGDFYDAFLLPSNYLGLVIADVCDKGVGSALFMALFRSLIRVFSGQISLSGLYLSKNVNVSKELDFIRPLNAVALTNDYIAEEHGEEGMFATLFFGVLNPISGELAYVNAGHEPLMIVGPSGSKAQLTAAGPAVGGMPGIRYEARRARLEPGDILIGYTDGVTEALSPDKQLFGKHRFTALAEQPADTATGLIKRIEDQISRHIQNATLFDDITMIALRRELR